MTEITIGNSYSTIKMLPPRYEKSLRTKLSYVVGGASAYYTGGIVRRKSLLSKHNEFPTGILYLVLEYLIKHNIDYSVQENRLSPKLTPRISLKTTFYDWQVEAADVACNVGRGTISACTGSGKSLLIALIASRLNVTTLVVVPSLEIKKQLLSTLQSVLGHNRIVVENIDSPLLKTMTKFDCLIIDEAHHVAARTYQRLNRSAWSGIYYRFFLTATPFRNDTEEMLLFESIAGQVIYKLDYSTAVSKNYIVPVSAYYIDLPKQKINAYTYQEVYKKLIVNNEARNALILGLLRKLENNEKYALCLVKEVKHGKNIGYSGFVHGEDDDSRELIEEFNTGGRKCLVATTGIMGEGVDTKPCEYVIIAGIGKAKSQFMQQVGRAVRKYPGKEHAKIIIFRDPSHKFTLRHFNAQKKILQEEYSCVLYKLELD